MHRAKVLLICLVFALGIPKAMAHPDGYGSFKHPVSFGENAVVGGLTVAVIDFERPAAGGDMPSSEDQEYVQALVELACLKDHVANCQIYPTDLEMAGDLGFVYENRSAFESIELEPGEQTSVIVKSLVHIENTQLLLLFTQFGVTPYTFPMVFHTEPQPQAMPSIEISPLVSLIARSGPSADMGFTGVLRRGEQLTASGRNEAGSWLELAFGWVAAEHIESDGEIMSLPITG